ncbi:MAG: hypothetical protein KC561_16850, partial [Myxococcales bacterium]|nr:hypothetical protein [Myxococcales bacterium]
LSAVSPQPVGFHFRTTSVTGPLAAEETDYVVITDYEGTFEPGVTHLVIPVTIIEDNIYEADEEFLVEVFNPTDGRVSASPNDKIVIQNDEPIPTVSIDDVSVTEGNSGTTTQNFTVSLSGPSEFPLTIPYVTQANTATAPADFGAADDSISVTPGTTQTTIGIQVVGDLLDEDDETYSVELGTLSDAVHFGYADSTGVGTILDDDPLPTLTIDGPAVRTVAEGNSGTTEVLIGLTLSAPSGRQVEVAYETSSGSQPASGVDYESLDGTAVFAPGETQATITLIVIGDTEDETDESLDVDLTGPVNVTLNEDTVEIVIDDDDGPTVSIADGSVSEGDAGNRSMTFQVSLSQSSPQACSVHYQTRAGTATAGSDFTATNGTLTINAGQTTGSIVVTIKGDVLNEANETLFVDLSSPVDCTIGDGEGLGTIVNDDPLPSLSVNNVTVSEGDSGTVSATFTITLSAASGRTVQVDYQTANGTATAGQDYQSASGSLTFNPGQTSKTVNVTVLGDLEDEGNETFSFQLQNAQNASLAAGGTGTGTIIDDDGPALSVSNAAVTEG